MKSTTTVFCTLAVLLSIGEANANMLCAHSRILLPIHFSTSALEEQLRQAVPARISGVEPLSIPIVRRGELRWSANLERPSLMVVDETLRGTVDVHGRMTVTALLRLVPGVRRSDTRLSESIDNIAVRLSLSVRPELTDNWKVKANLTSRTHISEISARLFFNGFPLSVPDILLSPLSEMVNEEVIKLNDYIYNSNALRNVMTGVWKDLHHNYPLQGEPPIWLKLKPIGIIAGQPRIVSSGAEFLLGIEAQTILSTSIYDSAEISELPPLQLIEGAASGRLNLALPVVVDWASANAAFVERLENRPVDFEGGSGRLRLEAAEFSGSENGKLVGSITFSVYSTGLWERVLTWIDDRMSDLNLNWRLSNTLEAQIVEMSAEPMLSVDGRGLRLVRAEIMENSSPIVKSVAAVYEWITSDTIARLVEDNLTINLANDLSTMEGQAQDYLDELAEMMKEQGLRISATVKETTHVDAVEITPDALVGKLCASVEASVQIDDAIRF